MSSALIRYGAKRAMPLVFKNNYLNRATKRARTVGYTINNYAKWRAAGKIARWGVSRLYRMRFNRYRKAVKGAGRYHNKSFMEMTSGSPALVVQTLYFDVIRFQNSSLQTTINARQSFRTKLKGIKICHQFNRYASAGGTDTPYEVHWALCQMKQDTDSVSDILPYIRTEFFRDTRSLNSRTRDFQDCTAVSPYDYSYNCLHLNKDRFNILSHKRRILNARDSNTSVNNSWTWKINKYFKINKQIEFTDMNDTFGKHPFFVVYWYNLVSSLDWPNAPADPRTINRLNVQYLYQTYYT